MIIAIDTSTQWMGISLFDASLVVYEKVWKTNRRHTVELSPAINDALQDTGTDKMDLQAVGVAIGPGSFTSLRIGLAAAKGLCLSLNIPLIGIPSLDISARGIPIKDVELICLLRAGRKNFAALKYFNKNGKWESTGELIVATAEDLEANITSRTLICGEMTSSEKKILLRRWRNVEIADPPLNIRRPSILANMAFDRFAAGDLDDVASTAPIYLRPVKNVDKGTPV